MPGPAPNPNARRRNKDSQWILLPEKCTQRAPAWPLPGKASAAEVKLWRTIWTTPMATRWHRLGWFVEVALYVRLVVRAAESSDAAVISELRQLGDRLGTTTLAIQKHRWVVAEPEQTRDPERTSRRTRAKTSGLRIVT